MKNNKGFISISVVYSFFVVFLMLLLIIVDNLVSNRLLLNSIKTEIKEDISNSTFLHYLIYNAEELNLVHHDSKIINGAMDNSYRYTGDNPSNYVCFGSDEENCPEDNLYRIIGIINGKIKLIHSNGVAIRQIDNTDTNYYVNTNIYNYLNNEFLFSLGNYADLIETSIWYVGGINASSLTDNDDIKNIYEKEVGSNRNNAIKVNAKIGLMYISEYAYATSVENYSTSITGNKNWLNNFQNNWTNTRVNTTTNQFFYINDTGNLAMSHVSEFYQIRPTFYLSSSVRLTGGDGTHASPYRIEG